MPALAAWRASTGSGARPAGDDAGTAGSTSRRSNSPPSTIATPGEAGVGDQQVRAPAHDQHRHLGLRGEHLGDALQIRLALDTDEDGQRAAAAIGRQRARRRVALDPIAEPGGERRRRPRRAS